MAQRNLRLTVLRNFGHSANDIFWFILPLVLPLLLVRFDLSYARAGGILTFYLAFTALGSYVLGRVSDKVPRRTVMGFGFLLSSAGLVAAAFADSFALFMVCLAFTGLGVSTFHPAMYAHIDEAVTVKKGRVLSFYEASGAAAVLVMFLVNGTLIATIGTRGVMLITAAPALVLGVLTLLSKNLDSVGDSGIGSQTVEAIGEQTPAVGPPISVGVFVLFLVSIVLRTASLTAVLNFLPTIFVNFFGLPTDRAAYATGLFFAGGIVGSLAAALFSEKRRSYAILIIGALIMAPCVAGLTLDLPIVFYAAFVFLIGAVGSGLIVNQNIILTTLGSRFGRGEAFGILMAVMTLAASVSPMLFGIVVDARGFPAALLTFSVPVFASAVLLLLLAPTVLKTTRMAVTEA